MPHHRIFAVKKGDTLAIGNDIHEVTNSIVVRNPDKVLRILVWTMHGKKPYFLVATFFSPERQEIFGYTPVNGVASLGKTFLYKGKNFTPNPRVESYWIALDKPGVNGIYECHNEEGSFLLAIWYGTKLKTFINRTRFHPAQVI